MLSLVASLALLQSDSKVTLDTAIQPLSAVVEALAQKTGRSLVVAPNLAREMVLVRVHQVPTDTLLPRLAQCVDAEWVQDGKRTRLVRSAATEKKLADAETATYAAWLRKNLERTLADEYAAPYDAAKSAQALRRQIDEWASAIVGDGPPSGGIPLRERRKRHAHLAGQPATQALVRLTKHLDLEALAALPNGEGLAYATAPLGDQLPFPKAALPEVAAFRRDLAVYAGALDGWSGQSSVASSETLDRVTLHIGALREPGGELSLSLRLHAYDRSNREVANGTLSLDTFDAEDPAPAGKPDLVDLTPRTSEVEEVYAHAVNLEEASPEVRNIALNSERFPRFAYQWTELLRALAGKSSTDVVANVSDELERISLAQKGKADLTIARAILKRRHEVTRDENWYLVRPTFPGPAGTRRHDRARTAAFIRSVAAGAPLSLEEAGTASPNDRAIDLILPHPACQGLSVFESAALLCLFSDETVLQIVGTLPPELRKSLLTRGGEIAWGQFGPDLQRVVYRTLLAAQSDTPTVGAGTLAAPGESEVSSGTSDFGDEVAERRRNILHQLFRNEGLSNARVTGEVVSRESLREVRLKFIVKEEPGLVRRGKAPQAMEFLTPPEVGLEIVPSLRGDREIVEEGDGPPEVGQQTFRTARHRQIQIRILLPGGFALAREAGDWAFDPRAPFVPANQLPPAHLKAIQAIRDRD